MAWTSATLGVYAPGGDLAALERGLEVVRNETSGGQSFSLKSVIQSSPFQLSLDAQTPLLHVLVIDEYLSQASRLERDDQGYLAVVDSSGFVDIRWAYCWLPLTDHGLVLMDRGRNRDFAFRVLSESASERKDMSGRPGRTSGKSRGSTMGTG